MIGQLCLLVGHPVGQLPVFIFIGGNKPYQIKRCNCKEDDLNSILNLMFEVVKVYLKSGIILAGNLLEKAQGLAGSLV
jgi:hypothetical protein